MDNKQAREAFEKWAAEQGYNVDIGTMTDSLNETSPWYDYSITQKLWWVWQAALSSRQNQEGKLLAANNAYKNQLTRITNFKPLENPQSGREKELEIMFELCQSTATLGLEEGEMAAPAEPVNQRLVDALKFYAKPETYEVFGMSDESAFRNIDVDLGSMARETLGKISVNVDDAEKGNKRLVEAIKELEAVNYELGYADGKQQPDSGGVTYLRDKRALLQDEIKEALAEVQNGK